jgi:hypothetical protein
MLILSLGMEISVTTKETSMEDIVLLYEKFILKNPYKNNEVRNGDGEKGIKNSNRRSTYYQNPLHAHTEIA